MKSPKDLRPYQRRAVNEIISTPAIQGKHTTVAPRALHVDMSLGKTIVVLTAASILLKQFETYGVLVLAPRLVAETVWAQEAARWSHTQHLNVCVLRGSNKRVLIRELHAEHHVWVINYEALPWLFTALNQQFLIHGRPPPFDTVVFDESTRIKNPEGMRAAFLHRKNDQGVCLLDHFCRRVGLTGTPIPKGCIDLWGQYLALDGGRALGDVKEVYLERYFRTDYQTGKISLAKGMKAKIQARIAPITTTLRAEDHLQLPPTIISRREVILPPDIREQYNSMEQQAWAELDGVGLVELNDPSSKMAKCRQIAGGVYRDTETGHFTSLHDIKLQALDSVVEEAGGKSVLCSYVSRGDIERIQKRYGRRLKVAYLGPGNKPGEGLEIINTWNRGEVDILLTHHQSAGHGLNLQEGGNIIVWMGQDWPLEGWLQLNGRLPRPGQKEDHVLVIVILATDTIDEAIYDRVIGRADEQNDFSAAMAALTKYRAQREGAT